MLACVLDLPAESELNSDSKTKFSVSPFLEFQDPNQLVQFKKYYSDILYRWELLEQETEILKFVKSSSTNLPELRMILKKKTFMFFKRVFCSVLEFTITCQYCQQNRDGNYCKTCRKFTFRCVICNLFVKRSSMFCIKCGHGGHTNHLIPWFQNEPTCPTGCGCNCQSNCSLITNV